MTKTKLIIGRGILFLIIGTVSSLVDMNLLKAFNVIDSDFPLFLFILIVITTQVICLNYGLRIKNLQPTMYSLIKD